MALSTILPPEIQHRHSGRHGTRVRLVTWSIAGLAGYSCMYSNLQAQSPEVSDNGRAQQQYELDVGVCNAAGLAAPQREACVREAGLRLDRARNGPPSNAATENQDGRATVVAPQGNTGALQGSEVQTTRDGRATVVVPTRP